MTSVFLCTIPHTGTQFFRKVFQDAGLEEVGFGNVKNGKTRGPGRFVTCHVTPAGLRDVGRFEGVLVTTTRNDADLEASWRRRGKDIETLNRYRKRWEMLLEHSPYILTIDADNRRTQRLDDLSKRLGIPLVAQWEQKVNASNG